MSFRPHADLRCPLDRLPLQLQDGNLRCTNQHSFDIARQGYANLLGAQDKRSRDPGDSKAMIAARQRFLEAGHYRPIADRLGDLLVPQLSPRALIVDAGCGEGYYLHQLHDRILAAGASESPVNVPGRAKLAVENPAIARRTSPAPSMVGFDISKWAMRAAGQRFAATWLVASNRQIPLADACADAVLDMFGFADFAAFARILKPTGLLVRVQANAGHLLELREIIYPTIRGKPRSTFVPSGFSRVSHSDLRYEIGPLDPVAIGDLLLMTPHFFRASAEGKARAAALRELTLSVDVSMDFLQKNTLLASPSSVLGESSAGPLAD